MKFTCSISPLLLLFLAIFTASSALGQLTAQDPTIYGTKPAYIDQSTIILEPHGAFSCQTIPDSTL